MRFSMSGFFDESVSPGHVSIICGPFRCSMSFHMAQKGPDFQGPTPPTLALVMDLHATNRAVKIIGAVLRCCWVAVYTHLMILFFMITLRCTQEEANCFIIAGVVFTGDKLSPVLFVKGN